MSDRASLLAPPLRSFAEMVENPFPWGEVWDFTRVQEPCAGLWNEPAPSAAIRGLINRFRIEHDRRVEEVEQLPWSSLEAERLVGFFCGWLEAEQGRMMFADLSAVESESDKTFLLYDTLIRFGWLEQQSREDLDPLFHARLFAALHAPGAPVNAEIARRLGDHLPGFATAVATIAMYLSRREGSRELTIVETATEQSMWDLKRRIGGWRASQDQRENIASEFVQTFQDDVDPIQAILNALNGKLDIMPQRVRERLERQACKKRISTRSLDEEVERAEEDGRMASIDRAAIKAYDKQTRTESLKDAVRYVRRIKPKLGRYLEAKLAGQNQREAAAACGVTPRTARNYEKEIGRLLLGFLSTF